MDCLQNALVGRAEEERAEGGLEVLIGRHATGPALGCAKDVAVPTQAQGLVVAVVAPVGVEHPLSASGHAVAHEVADVDVRPVEAREDAVPGADTGADPEPPPGLGEDFHGGVLAGGMIVPVEQDDVVGQFADEFRVMEQDITPDLDAPSVAGGQFAHTQDVIEIDTPNADLVGQGFTGSLAQVVGFVAVHVEGGRGEGGQHVGVEFVQQCVSLLKGRAQCPEEFCLRQVLVLWDEKRVAGVTKRLQVGHQFDVASTAETVQFQHVLIAEGTAAGPNFGMAGELEGVLGVELKDVEFVVTEFFGQLLERGQRRHFATGDIEHEAAIGQRGPVPDGQRRQGLGLRIRMAGQRWIIVQSYQLAQGLDGVKEAGGCVGVEGDAGRCDGQGVGLCRHSLRRIDGDRLETKGRCLLRPAGEQDDVFGAGWGEGFDDGQRQAGGPAHLVLELPGGEKDVVADLGGDDDESVGVERERAVKR